MPTIEPPKFTTGEFNLPSGLGKGLANFGRNLEGPGGFGKKHLQAALALDAQHHSNIMEHLNRTGEIFEEQQAKAHEHAKELQSLTHEQGKETEQQKADIASSASAQEHNQLLEAASKKAEIDEAASAGTHARNLEFHKVLTKAAQSGTEVNWRAGDVSATFTKNIKANKLAAEASSAPATPGKSWAQTPAGATTLPIISKPAPTSKKKTTGPSVARDPKTGQAMSLKKI